MKEPFGSAFAFAITAIFCASMRFRVCRVSNSSSNLAILLPSILNRYPCWTKKQVESNSTCSDD